MANRFSKAALVFSVAASAVMPLTARERSVLIVNVVDYTNASPTTLVRAEHHLIQVYGAAGVLVLWRENLPLPAADSPARVDVHILSESMVRQKSASEQIQATVLGTAAPAAKRAWIFLGRIEDVAHDRNISPGVLLGHVIAHEVAHAVANIQHSNSGLMAQAMDLKFDTLPELTKADSQKVRAALDLARSDTSVRHRSQ